jgi:hypothetical protein
MLSLRGRDNSEKAEEWPSRGVKEADSAFISLKAKK